MVHLAWLIPLMELEFLQELAFINDEPENLEDSPQYDLAFHSSIAGNSGQVGDIIHPSDPEDDTISTEDQDVDMDYEFIPIQDIIDSDQDNGPPKPDYLGDFLVARASTLRTLSLEGSDLIGFCLFQAFKGTIVSIDSGSRSASTSSGNGSPDLPVLALRHLNLSKTTILRSGSVVEPLLRQCPDLETLDISDNFDPSWDNFQWSILHQFCLKLTSLSLKGLSSIDNSQLVQVVKKCPGLCSLIAPQSNLSSSVLDAIVDQRIAGPSVNQGGTTQQPAPFLELDVSWCTGITQDAIEKVLQHLPTLKRIRFSWCQEINLSVFQCNWSCLDLQELDAQGLDKPTTVSPEAIFTPEHYMFKRISQLRSLRRLLIGSDEVNMTVADGFGLLAGNDNGSIEGLVEKAPLSKLEYLELVGSEHPLGVPELTVIADSLPRLNRFHFGLGLVTCEMQSWLSSRRPDIQQEEQQIYF
ncbi:hypothetical protein BGZ49_006772 [Haplosporangium sp. Z 27]|nr:hypothetical protein BGZ49_006772 [Haplosporangium sp. Z 27]